jgi:hypothetical protein
MAVVTFLDNPSTEKKHTRVGAPVLATDLRK